MKSFGTEGRDPENEIPPSDNVYEYIVFRGSDVKDLRIEKEPEKKTVQQPQVPDDPAILGVSDIFNFSKVVLEEPSTWLDQFGSL